MFAWLAAVGEQLRSSSMSQDSRQRARVFRRARIVVLALVIGYFFLPYGVRAWIPVWLVFLAALGLEVQFFLGGYLQAQRGRPAPSPDPGPQPRDLAELGSPWWWQVPAEEGGRPYGRYVLEAVAGLALGAVILFFASRPPGWDAVSTSDQARAEAVYSREASRIAGHPARVGCDKSGEYVGFTQDADGVATVGGKQAYVTPSICDTLYQLAFKHRVQSFSRTARALAVLAHESWHLRGVTNEGLANCYGFQSGVQIGVRLGLEESKARAMMREQLATNASDVGSNTEYVVPSGCHDGGSEDLHPGVRGFP
jgi:hypothetical protein